MLSIWSDLGLDIKKDPSSAFQLYSPQLVGRFLQKIGIVPDEVVLQWHSLNIHSLLQLDIYKGGVFPLRSNIETLQPFLKLCGAQKKCTEKNGEKVVIGRCGDDFSARPILLDSKKKQAEQIEAFNLLYKSSSATEALPELITKSLGEDAVVPEDNPELVDPPAVGESSEEDVPREKSSKKARRSPSLTNSTEITNSTDSPAKPRKHKKTGSKDSKDSKESKESKDSPSSSSKDGVRKGSVGSTSSPKLKIAKK